MNIVPNQNRKVHLATLKGPSKFDNDTLPLRLLENLYPLYLSLCFYPFCKCKEAYYLK